jgi:hypothetical protein
MFDINSVIAFGKIFFIPTAESIPPLPEMNLLFWKKKNAAKFSHGGLSVSILK